MKATAQSKDRTPAPLFRPHYSQTANGRTKKAYEHQPRPLKWKCDLCIRAGNAILLKAEKGRSRLNAKEIEECSFKSKYELDAHSAREHGE